MTFAELKKLVQKGEGLFTEFKRKANHPDKIMKEVVAFANTHGGKLLIGVDDDGTIAGLKYANEDEFELRKAIEVYCKPSVRYQVTKVLIATNRSVLVFDILPSTEKPVFLIYNFKKNTGVAYIRVADQSLQASREMRKILQGTTQNQDTVFMYTQKEQILLQYIAKNTRIDVQTFATIANIPIHDASDILVRLTLSKVLQIQAEEMKDWFTEIGAEK
jgi:predicted HTH transcriptional regulator